MNPFNLLIALTFTCIGALLALDFFKHDFLLSKWAMYYASVFKFLAVVSIWSVILCGLYGYFMYKQNISVSAKAVSTCQK